MTYQERKQHRSFNAFVKTILSSKVTCDGLNIQYVSPSLGELSFGWAKSLIVNVQEVQIHHYQRFDNPYIQTEFGKTTYLIRHNGKVLRI